MSFDDSAAGNTQKGQIRNDVTVNIDKMKNDGDAREELRNEETKVDPWALPELKDTSTPWSELTCGGKFHRVFVEYILRLVFLVVLLYLFICALDFMSSAFKILGGKAAGRAFADNELLANPVAGLMIGVLATVLVQSSSTSTSIVVTMVASKILYVRPAIPIIMGANIGTSVTNTIVSIGHISNKDEFRRAFAGATVHDMFNWLSVIILLPLEAASGYLYHLTKAIINSMDLRTYTSGKKDLLKTITKPFTSIVIQIDKKIIEKIAKGDEEAEKKSLMKTWCKYNVTQYTVEEERFNVTEINGLNVTTNFTETVTKRMKVGLARCKYMFMNVAGIWDDNIIGAILLVISLFLLCLCLVLIVKTLNALLKGRIAIALKKFVNADFPGKCSFLTGYLAILLGAGLTVLVQSSSIFTSALTPLVGVGVLSLDRMYPLTLGANIGTTATGLLASLASDGDQLPNAMQVAFCHLFFNITGIIIFYPIPFMRKLPINMAKFLGMRTCNYRWFPIVYLIFMFFLLPGAIFGLSLIGWQALVGVGVPILALVIAILIIKLIQAKRPSCLPVTLKNWKFLPECLRSLAPIDRFFGNIVRVFKCRSCSCKDEEHAYNMRSPSEGVMNRGLHDSINTMSVPDSDANGTFTQF
ncbi:sodium-dependent phosphate transport protein 2B-like isoform X1 [Tubulanus polymorphus]|uniref:sodium-dependent phosphate transport protein 2B-like isoform X1 n=1 Tax=Tubulanus polymorphus TaxID=672921 RepID=UPI003DA3886D